MGNEELISSTKSILLGKIKCNTDIIGDMFSVIDDEWNEVLLINVNLKDLACLADTDQSCFAKGFSGYENQGVRKFLSVKKN